VTAPSSRERRRLPARWAPNAAPGVQRAPGVQAAVPPGTGPAVPWGVLAVVLAAGMAAGWALAAGGGPDAPWLALLTLLLVGALLVRVPVPWGGSVPLGYALAPAVLALPLAASLVVATALAGALVVAVARRGRPAARAAVLRLAPPLLLALVAAAVHGALRPDAGVLEQVVVAGTVLCGADLVVVWHWPDETERVAPVAALPVYLTLLCGAALVAVATSGFGVVMAAVAALPLLITRFSFRRYAAARETLRQTVQALGLVPELAGLVPLGHSERTAAYAAAVARGLGLRRAACERIVTASRLQHVGAVPGPAGDDVAASGARLLRESGFPADVAALVASARVGCREHAPPTIDAAVVRVATTFDEVVGEDHTAVPRGLAVVSSTAHDRHSRRATAALLEVTASSPSLVADAIAGGDRFRRAASDLRLEDLLAEHGIGADIVPFRRRRAGRS
jgi:hypothetical protein